MSITFPPEMLPSGGGDLDEIDIVVDGQTYRWRDGRWITEDGKILDPVMPPRVSHS